MTTATAATQQQNYGATPDEVRGLAPNGETMYRWTEPDGSVWEDYWHPVPGGGLVMGHQVGGAE